jgi:hypothetical protein
MIVKTTGQAILHTPSGTVELSTGVQLTMDEVDQRAKEWAKQRGGVVEITFPWRQIWGGKAK